MQARRSLTHGADGGWSSVALHLHPADAPQEGFYLTLFSDARPATTVFLRSHQLAHLVDLATQPANSDQQVWEVVSKIPLEPLLPSRTLATRLRWLLVDCAASLREEIRVQAERLPPASPEPEPQAEPAPDEPPKPTWS